jgi:hypothetical protein
MRLNRLCGGGIDWSRSRIDRGLRKLRERVRGVRCTWMLESKPLL